ncbi:hypothetical protein C0Q70_14894 [Pomacea canaliculata]|uniref:Anaphase-promoting complex subunit 4 WD40 domain-containing protein n=1 Tax=Pomacea canaliculata TaxID=400727 RepID=A0A2T7NTC1_POMCA|nr:hypothetical protein C0Q70_14894 [Pomacea canaliculata]
MNSHLNVASADEKFLVLGTFSGDLKLINMSTGEEASSLNCHNSSIIHLEPSQDGKLLLTSSWGISEDSAMWTIDYFFHRCTFDEHLLEFSKLTQDRIVGTKDDVAHIYDVMTGTKLMKLFDPEKTNNYYANAATFSPTDELVLNDGVLWDVRSQKLLHKFNRFISGVFHPMGQDIIINSEIISLNYEAGEAALDIHAASDKTFLLWDQQTFKLLHTVPALDQCQIKFNHAGDVNFANRIEDEMETNFEELRIQFSSTLKTFNATDYSSIGTMDLKTPSIFDLCIDKSDFCLAVIEQNTQFTDGGSKKSICHLYQTGKLQDEEDDGICCEGIVGVCCNLSLLRLDIQCFQTDTQKIQKIASLNDLDGNEEGAGGEAVEVVVAMALGISNVENCVDVNSLHVDRILVGLER